MSETTRYLVDIDYRLTGIEKALANTKAAGAATDKLARSMEWVKRAALAVGGAFIFGKIKSLLIDSNKELESMQIGMQTVLATTLGRPFESMEGAARRTVEHYRNIAKVSPGVAADFLEFHNLAAGAVLSSGGTLGDLKRITEGGVIAAKAFGFRGDVAGRDVQQALTNKVTMQTPLIKMLAGSEAEVAKINATHGKKRVDAIKKLFDSRVMADAAAKYGESFEGRLSTLQETASSTFRAIGAPLFKQLNSWLKQINDWADRNAVKLAGVASTIGNALTTGAQWMLKAATFIVNNAKTIALIAGVGLAVKGGFMLGGGMLQKDGLFGKGGVTGALKSLASSASFAAIAIGALAIGLPALFTQMDKVFGDVRGWAMNVAGPQAREAVEAEERARAKAVQQAGALSFIDSVSGNVQGAFDDALKNSAKQPRNPKVNVTIKKIEVVANDPDRLMHAMVKRIGKELRAPGQSIMMPRGT